MIIENLVVGSFACNCTIIGCEKTNEAVVIDPGDEPDKILEIINHYNLKIKYLLHTHAHLDHIMGTKKVKQKTQGEIVLHKDDLNLYNQLKIQAGMFGINTEDPCKVDKFVENNEIIDFGENNKTKVIHTPGHSPGSICFHFSEMKKPLLFSGDTLFAQSIGRTDLWGGNHSLLLSSIKNNIFSLPEETIVCPGHGPKTSVWEEKKKNPFFN